MAVSQLKCTGESSGCRRCQSKDITCSYPDPSQRTRQSRDIQKRARSKRIPQVPLPPPLNPTENPASDQAAPSHELIPARPSPWTGASFQTWNEESFTDSFLGNGSISHELEFLSEDLQVEGAGFFPLDHYSCLNEVLGTGTQVPPAEGQSSISRSF